MTTKISKLVRRRIGKDTARRGPASIPRIIHQTFKTSEVSERMGKAMMTWVECNPSFEYRFYDNEDCAEFIKNHFGQKVFEAYQKIGNGAFRADLWRYCVLLKHGGVYSDVDTVCRVDLDKIIRPDDEFIVPRAGNLHFAVFNAFICSRAGHPFLEKAIESAVSQVLKSDSFDGYMVTGPGNLGMSINRCLGRAERDAHEFGSHANGNFNYRIIEKRAANVDGPRRVVDGETTVLFTEYDGYRQDLESAGVKHWTDAKRKVNVVNGAKKLIRRAMKWLMRRFTA